jgi:hypothetical protein
VLKAAHKLPPADPAREAQQIARLRHLAEDAGLDPDFAEKFLNFIIARSHPPSRRHRCRSGEIERRKAGTGFRTRSTKEITRGTIHKKAARGGWISHWRPTMTWH